MEFFKIECVIEIFLINGSSSSFLKLKNKKPNIQIQKEALISYIWKSITVVSRTMPNVQENQAFTMSTTSVIKPNGPAIWRAERKEIAWWAILAKEPACRGGMLPDASTGQNPGTLAANLSRCKPACR
jgi:hypothetical protein